MKKRTAVLTSLLALVFTSLAHAATYTEGVNYFLVSPAQHTNVPAGKIEVTEVFSYACPFCAQFNPLIDKYRAQKLQMILMVWGIDYPDPNDYAYYFSPYSGPVVARRMFYLWDKNLTKIATLTS